MLAEFVEKQFETAANQELHAWSSSQVAEEFLGFDATASPDLAHEVWSYLGVSATTGVVLVPDHWSGSPKGKPPVDSLAPIVSSIVLQYKRPHYMKTSRAKHWHLWNAPHFRFAIEKVQQTVLLALESELGAGAYVRYAAPAFHKLTELVNRWQAGTVLAASGFVSPSSLAGHSAWTYRYPGTDGIANPDDGRRVLFESSDRTFGDLRGSRTNATEILSTLRSGMSSVLSDRRLRVPDLGPDFQLRSAGSRQDLVRVVSDLRAVGIMSGILGVTTTLVIGS